MRQLIIDTATEALSVALYADGSLVEFHHEIAGRGHAEKLLPIIASMDAGGRADEIIVDSGPGSFTGVRVGLAAARALAYGWNARLRAYESLLLIAAMAQITPTGKASPDSADEAPIAVTMNGGHGEVFWRLFDRATLTPLSDTTSTPIAQLAEQLDTATLYGSGAPALVDLRGHGLAVPMHPDARQIPLLPDKWLQDDTTPLYGRGADAIPLAERKS